jgi:protein-tyrosine phosphatase
MLGDYNEVIPGKLWVGSYCRPGDSKQLHRMGITTVVSLQTDLDLKGEGISLKKLVKSLAEADIDLVRVPLQDFNEEALTKELSASVETIESLMAPGWAKVYLHCTAGVQRSPTVAAAYMMKSRGWPAGQAYDYLIEKRNCRPYRNILEQYEKALKTTAKAAWTEAYELSCCGPIIENPQNSTENI